MHPLLRSSSCRLDGETRLPRTALRPTTARGTRRTPVDITSITNDSALRECRPWRPRTARRPNLTAPPPRKRGAQTKRGTSETMHLRRAQDSTCTEIGALGLCTRARRNSPNGLTKVKVSTPRYKSRGAAEILPAAQRQAFDNTRHSKLAIFNNKHR